MMMKKMMMKNMMRKIKKVLRLNLDKYELVIY